MARRAFSRVPSSGSVFARRRASVSGRPHPPWARPPPVRSALARRLEPKSPVQRNTPHKTCIIVTEARLATASQRAWLQGESGGQGCFTERKLDAIVISASGSSAWTQWLADRIVDNENLENCFSISGRWVDRKKRDLPPPTKRVKPL